MKQKIEWLITLEGNGLVCADCGKTEDKFITHFCDARTYGMYKYNHLEFQLVLHMNYKMIAYTLNALGLMVQAGRIFKNGDLVDGLFEGYVARLDEFEDGGQKLLRVIIPDANHKFPNDEGCELEYSFQSLPIEDLYKANITNQKIN